MNDQAEAIFQGRTWVDKVLAVSIVATIVLACAPVAVSIVRGLH